MTEESPPVLSKSDLITALRELQQVSLEMDELARRAQEERDAQHGPALVGVVGRWVRLVEGFVAFCPPGDDLRAYQAATRVLEDLLKRLEELRDPDKIRALEHEFPPAVDTWSEALMVVIQRVLAAAA
ncbi:MAG: hypothetical protein AB1758_38410 [Candidatus Eremiobacterota bacterium]